MRIEIESVTIPACWINYLVNADASDLAPGEADHIERFLDRYDGFSDIQESHFTWAYSLYDGGFSGAEGGLVCEATAWVQKEDS